MLIDLQHKVGGYFHDVFVNNVDWWVLLGVVAQGLFTMRFVVQWWASEKAKRSVVPIAFNFPACTDDCTTGAGANIRSMRPPSRSVMPGPVPL